MGIPFIVNVLSRVWVSVRFASQTLTSMRCFWFLWLGMMKGKTWGECAFRVSDAHEHALLLVFVVRNDERENLG